MRFATVLSWVIAGCIVVVHAGPTVAQEQALTPQQAEQIERLVLKAEDAVVDGRFRVELTNIVALLRRRGALDAAAFAALTLDYVPLFRSMLLDSAPPSIAARAGPHLAYSGKVHAQLQEDAFLAGAVILVGSGVPRERITNAMRAEQGTIVFMHALAYIVAHEGAHHELGHTVRGAPSQSERREREIEADQRAFAALLRIGASLTMLRQYFGILAAKEATEADPPPESALSHPRWATRLRRLDAFIAAQPPSFDPGGLVEVHRWDGAGVERETIVLRGSAPLWSGAVAVRSGVGEPALVRMSWVERRAGGATLWSRQGASVERRELDWLRDAPGWLAVKLYRRDGPQWKLVHQAVGIQSSLAVMAATPAIDNDFAPLLSHDPAADMAASLAAPEPRQKVQALLRQREELLRGVMGPFLKGEFGVLELGDRMRALDDTMRSRAAAAGVESAYAQVLHSFVAAGQGTATSRLLGSAGRERLRQLAAQARPVPSGRYQALNRAIHFQLPGQPVREPAVWTAADRPAGVEQEVYRSQVHGLDYVVMAMELPPTAALPDAQSLALSGLEGAKRQAVQSFGAALQELDRRVWRRGGTAIAEAAFQLEGAAPLRLRVGSSGRHSVMTMTTLGGANEADVIDGWQIVAP